MSNLYIYSYLKRCDKHTQDSLEQWRARVDDLYHKAPQHKVYMMARRVFEATWSKVGYVVYENEKGYESNAPIRNSP